MSNDLALSNEIKNRDWPGLVKWNQKKSLTWPSQIKLINCVSRIGQTLFLIWLDLTRPGQTVFDLIWVFTRSGQSHISWRWYLRAQAKPVFFKIDGLWCSGKPMTSNCTPPHLSEVWPALPLKQFSSLGWERAWIVIKNSDHYQRQTAGGSKHIEGSKEMLFMRTKTQFANFQGKRWKMRLKAKSLICFCCLPVQSFKECWHERQQEGLNIHVQWSVCIMNPAHKGKAVLLTSLHTHVDLDLVTACTCWPRFIYCMHILT